MIQFITGLPRSGKSYRAVDYIKNKFIDPKNKEYKKHTYLYTNIGGFKHDEVQLFLESNPIETENDIYTKKTIAIDWDKFYNHLTKLHQMAQADKTDNELLEYCEKYKLTPALFVVDECYKYFKKHSDPVLVWWLAYHGHLGHDIILLLQNKNLIHFDYKSFTEEFIDAQPKSMSLSNNTFRYYHYASEQYFPEQRFSTTKLKADEDVFNLYKSGDLYKPSKVIAKYYVAMAAGVLLAGGIFYSMLTSESQATKHAYEESEKIAPNQSIGYQNEEIVQEQTFKTDSNIYIVRCSSTRCWLVDDNYESNDYPIDYFKMVVLKNKLIYLYSKVDVEAYKKVIMGNSVSKQTIASITDYYYDIDTKMARHYFPKWFEEQQVERETLFDRDKEKDTLTNINRQSEGAPAEAQSGFEV